MTDEQLFAAGVIWVGGLGFLFFTYPALVCRITRQQPTPSRLKRIHVIGAIELILVFLGAIGQLIAGFYAN